MPDDDRFCFPPDAVHRSGQMALDRLSIAVLVEATFDLLDHLVGPATECLDVSGRDLARRVIGDGRQ